MQMKVSKVKYGDDLNLNAHDRAKDLRSHLSCSRLKVMEPYRG